MENPEIKNPLNPLQDSNDIMNAFKQKFATTVHKIRVNSLNREIGFRDVTTKEQKTLSKTTLENENRKDVIYDTQCQLINTLCLEDGFTVYKLTEFDRIRLLMEIYQSNYFKNDITYKCKECGKENVYKLDFQKIIDKFNEFVIEDQIYTAEDENYEYNFTLNWPLVRTVSNFYRDYMKKYNGVTSIEREVLDNFGNIEYINLFIKKVELVNKKDSTDRVVADLTMMPYEKIEQFIDMFPQHIIFAESGSVISHITEEFIQKINNVFEYEKCQHCGAKSKEGIGNLIDFF